MCRLWLDYLRRKVFLGGCFFAAASFEFDGRPGPVRSAIKVAMFDWLKAIEKAVQLAKEEGHLRPSIDAAQLAFEINSIFFGANFAYQLRSDTKALQRAERAIDDRLQYARIVANAPSSRRAHRTPPHRLRPRRRSAPARRSSSD